MKKLVKDVEKAFLDKFNKASSEVKGTINVFEFMKDEMIIMAKALRKGTYDEYLLDDLLYKIVNDPESLAYFGKNITYFNGLSFGLSMATLIDMHLKTDKKEESDG